MPETTLRPDDLPRDAIERVRQANLELARTHPGAAAARQPVHTVYGGAHLFRADTARKLGDLALASLDEYLPDADAVRGVFRFDANALDVGALRERVAEKLRREPVEDLRIDFEDGYGYRPDAEEDAHAAGVAAELARGHRAGTLPPFIGLRIKPFAEESRGRALRTLDLVLTGLRAALDGPLPAPFRITLPKVTSAPQVALLAAVLQTLEDRLAVPRESFTIELMVETPQALLAPDGTFALPRLVAAAAGRCTGAHFGAYDYTAACDVAATHQSLAHPACDFARNVMQVALCGTAVTLSDGATTLMPVAPHRARAGAALSDEERARNRRTVHRAFGVAYENVRRALAQGFYQGWDLHPAQLVPRYAAVYAFFLEGLEASGRRLRGFVERAAQATLLGDVFDDAATGQGLLNYFLRAMGCGAITLAEAEARAGLTADELRTRSFARILAGRGEALRDAGAQLPR